jgi:hypothetical protein
MITTGRYPLKVALRRSEQTLTSMTLAEFQDLLDRQGEDLSLWSAPQQQAAALLLESSEQARAARDEARQLRQALAAPPVRAPAGLTDRIMQRIRDTDAASSTDSALPDESSPSRSLVETKSS